ncbi:MAG: AgmX/PglI C-terminal domain-containing protein [Myxococcota bacterium]
MPRSVVLSAFLLLGATQNVRAEQDAAPIKAAVRGALPAVQACYESRLKEDPTLEGRLVVEIRLGKDAVPADIRVVEDQLGSAPVAACVVGALREVRFPASAANVQLVHPFAFAPTRTLAVLPFDNLAGDKQLEWLRTGIAESLVTKLGQISKLVLVDRLKLDQVLAEQALGQSGAIDPASAANAGKLVGAQLLVTGSYQKAGDKLRLHARVVEAETGRVRQAVEATGRLDDVFALQDELAGRIVDIMNIPPSADRDAALALKVANSMEVLRILGQASNALHGVGGPRDKARAAALYRQVIALDPNIPEAHLGLALSLWTSGGQELNPDVEAPLRKALELRPAYHEALTYLAFHLWRTGRNDEALALEQRALALKPDYALGTYAVCISLASQGKADDAIALCRRAVELDPRNSEFRTQLGQLIAVFKRDYPAARELTRVAVDAHEEGEWSYAIHAYVLLMSGDTPACLKTIDAGRTARGKQANPGHAQMATAVEAACRARAGDAKGARAALDTLPDGPRKTRLLEKAPVPPQVPAFDRIMWTDIIATYPPPVQPAKQK